MKTIDRLQRVGVVPVVVIEDAGNAAATAEAMVAGGIDVMEITFRTEAAPEAIRIVAEQCPEMLVGAGTILTLAQCQQAVDCGAKFIVSPGFDAQVAVWCAERDIPIVPGCVTPTEIMEAMKLGLEIVKFFPANVYGGLNAMKNLNGPFGGIRFIPTGGIHMENMAEYLKAPYIFAVGGSWVCPKNDLAAKDFAHITQLCREAANIVRGVRPCGS